MALIACLECGKEVSRLAASCPSFGAPIASMSDRQPTLLAVEGSPKEASRSSSFGLLWKSAIFIILIAVGASCQKITGHTSGTTPEEVCNVLFKSDLSDPQRQSDGQRMLVLDDIAVCTQQMDRLRSEAPEHFNKISACVVKATSYAAAVQCG